jgi:hypothetical protein
MSTKTKNNDPVEPQVEPEINEDAKVIVEETTVPTSGKRQSLLNIRRQLTNEELSQSGTQKMLLEMLEEAENHGESMKNFEAKYYTADKQSAILNEKLNADRSIEVFFGTGIGLGGAILGLSPFFWSLGSIYGALCLLLGICLILGASIGRAIKK